MVARLSLHKITKAYSSLVANDNIDLDVAPGEILAILGENGAGKSTLMKIIYGAVTPDSGTVEFDGQAVTIDSPSTARNLGIAMVHQHFALFESLTVAQNVLLGLSKKMHLSEVQKRVKELGDRYGLSIDPNVAVADLSMGERQRVEIIRALMTDPTLLILDEPTSVLTPQAVQTLFVTLKKIALEGVSILFISHKLDEIRAFTDRCAVLRAGKLVTIVDPRTQTIDSLARLMIGAEPPKLMTAHSEAGETVFELRKVNLQGGRRVCGVYDVRLSLRAGEIVGVAGISGNGQSRLLGVCAGELLVKADSVKIFGHDVGNLDPSDRRKMGLRFVPEERLGHGAVPELSLTSNSLLTGKGLHKGGFILRDAAQQFTQSVIDSFQVKSSGTEAQARSLSGGNLQKFIVGREILGHPKILIIDQPTWGVDVGAATLIRNALMELRAQGVAVLVVSEEIDELFEICDRISVMYRGYMSPAVPKNSITVQEVGRWMSGLWPGSPFNHRPQSEPLRVA